jgi:hypothetical protein
MKSKAMPLRSAHSAKYGRAFPAKEKLDGLRAVSPGLSVLAYGLKPRLPVGLDESGNVSRFLEKQRPES